MFLEQGLSTFDISDSNNLIATTETEQSCKKMIKRISWKYLILKIITFGCCNSSFSEKRKNKIEPWVKKLIEIEKENISVSLKADQFLDWAEKMIKEIEENQFESFLRQQNNDDSQEEFYDALDNQPWFLKSQVNVDSSQEEFYDALENQKIFLIVYSIENSIFSSFY